MKFLTNYVPQGTGGMSGYVVVEDNGILKAQKLSFDGTTPQFDGVAEEITDVGIFETGLDEPAYNGSGGGGTAKYYKCASVDATNKTWAGYELVLEDGVYVVSDALTDGLTYSAMTPKVNEVYTTDALIKIGMYYTGMPTDGLVFYASLNGKTPDVAETGQTFTANITTTYTTVQGVPCISVNDFTGYFEDTNLPIGSSSRTISCWVKKSTQDSGDSEATFFAYGTGNHGQSVDFCFVSDYLGADNYHGQFYDGKYINKTQWHHVVLTYNEENNVVCLYVDGVNTYNSTWSRVPITTLSGKVYIGRGASGDYSFGQGYLAACRVYNRILSQEEITLLAQEFTPTGA